MARRIRPVGLTILSLLTASATAVGTWGLSGVVDLARADILNAAAAEPALPVDQGTACFTLCCLIVGALLSFAHQKDTAEVLSKDFGKPVAWAGATVAAVVAAHYYRVPAQVGVGDVTDPDAPWQWYQWGLYVFPVAFPTLLSFKLVFSVRRVARKISDLHLRAHGQLTRGTVTAVKFRNTWYLDQPMFWVTFTFDTAAGPRAAIRGLRTEPAEAPIVGGTVQVWYDPESPDPERLSMDRDPDSPIDPENAKRYAPPSD